LDALRLTGSKFENSNEKKSSYQAVAGDVDAHIFEQGPRLVAPHHFGKLLFRQEELICRIHFFSQLAFFVRTARIKQPVEKFL
jgi:hypothetical protein